MDFTICNKLIVNDIKFYVTGWHESGYYHSNPSHRIFYMNRFAVCSCCATSALLLFWGCGGKVQDSSSETDPGAGIPSLAAPDLGAMPSDDQAASDAAPPAHAFDFTGERPTNEQGEEISDLAILNDALLGYLDPTARGVETAVPLPKDLNDLVRAGFLKNLPKPPPGKKFVLDTRRVEIRLENQ
jgi:hypothetical protein